MAYEAWCKPSRPLPGFPKVNGTGTSESGTASKATEAVAEQTVTRRLRKTTNCGLYGGPKGADAVDEAAAAKVSTRSWSDADLSKLANQAATKLGDPCLYVNS